MDFRQRLEQGRMALAANTAPVEFDMEMPSTYYAVERGRNPVCLELRLPEGKYKALPYSHFNAINYDIEIGIEIRVGPWNIRITGRNLGKLFDHLVAYRVRFIQANSGADATEGGLFVKEIVVENAD